MGNQPMLPPHPPGGHRAPHVHGLGGLGGITRVVVHQVVQAGEGEAGRDVEPAVLQAVDAVVGHRVPGGALAVPNRQRVAACRAGARGTWLRCCGHPPCSAQAAVRWPMGDVGGILSPHRGGWHHGAARLRASPCQPRAISTSKLGDVGVPGWEMTSASCPPCLTHPQHWALCPVPKSPLPGAGAAPGPLSTQAAAGPQSPVPEHEPRALGCPAGSPHTIPSAAAARSDGAPFYCRG